MFFVFFFMIISSLRLPAERTPLNSKLNAMFRRTVCFPLPEALLSDSFLGQGALKGLH